MDKDNRTMRKENRHPTEADLLRAAAGELSRRRAADLTAHLARCETCRVRLEGIAETTATLAYVYGDAQDQQLSSAAAAREVLQSRLAAIGNDPRHASWFSRSADALRAPAWAYAVGILLLGGLWLGFHRSAPRYGQTYEFARKGVGPLVPNAALTPGAVEAVTMGDVCAVVGPTERRPPLSVQRAVFHEYGMDGAPPLEYEVDHLITPALGGTDDIRNLWPESYSSEWNAHVKDDLEDRLHELVCQGRLDLSTAQRDMATNWISAYKKYFHSDKPLQHNSALIVSRRKPRTS
jgi:hypothetical protein